MSSSTSGSHIKVEFHLDALDKAANERVSKLLEKAVNEELAKQPVKESIATNPNKILLGIRNAEPGRL